MERVIAYANRTLSKSKRNYDTHKLEFLALKWSIVERFHEYLYGGHFELGEYTSKAYGTIDCQNNVTTKTGI